MSLVPMEFQDKIVKKTTRTISTLSSGGSCNLGTFTEGMPVFCQVKGYKTFWFTDAYGNHNLYVTMGDFVGGVFQAITTGTPYTAEIYYIPAELCEDTLT